MTFSVLESTHNAIRLLVEDPLIQIHPEVKDLICRMQFTNESSPINPCPFRQVEVAAALKAIEAAMVNVIGNRRFGYEQDVMIDFQHTTL